LKEGVRDSCGVAVAMKEVKEVKEVKEIEIKRTK